MAFRARKSFATGRTFVQEGNLYDTDFGVPDRFDVVTTPDSDEQVVKSASNRGVKKTAPKAEKADEAKDD